MGDAVRQACVGIGGKARTEEIVGPREEDRLDWEVRGSTERSGSGATRTARRPAPAS
jgi:hypothetical protein